MPSGTVAPVLALDGVSLVRDGTSLVDNVSWHVRSGEQWAILGCNGSGKTTLARIAAWLLHPSAGTLRLGEMELGRCDARLVRRRIGFVSAAFADMLRRDLIAADVVMCAIHGALEPWWHDYDGTDRDRAIEALDMVGISALARRAFGTLSSGERQRVLLARALMTQPELLVLDEPCAGLDLVGREQLVEQLEALASRADAPPLVLVTHHLEEIPATATHVLMLRAGSVTAQGSIDEQLDSNRLSACLGLGVSVNRVGRRWSAQADGEVSRTVG